MVEILGFLVFAAVIVWLVVSVRRDIVRESEHALLLDRRGWTRDQARDPSLFKDLACPPFATGLRRTNAMTYTGLTRDGRRFATFTYLTNEFGTLDTHVAVVHMSRSFPEFYAVPDGIEFPPVKPAFIGSIGAHRLFCNDAAYAQYATHYVACTLSTLAHESSLANPRTIAITVDHDRLIAMGVPKMPTNPDEFDPILDALSRLATSLESDPQVAHLPEPEPAREHSFYHHPTWMYEPRNDDYFERYGLEKHYGTDHAIESIVVSNDPLLPFEAFFYTWETTDSDNDTTYHQEPHVWFYPQFRFLPLQIGNLSHANKGLREWTVNGAVRVDWKRFNHVMPIRSPHQEFALDVCHPAMLRYLSETLPPAFAIVDSGALIVNADPLTSIKLAWLEQFFLGFFARVPDHVWVSMGVSRPNLPPPEAIHPGEMYRSNSERRPRL